MLFWGGDITRLIKEGKVRGWITIYIYWIENRTQGNRLPASQTNNHSDVLTDKVRSVCVCGGGGERVRGRVSE